MKTVSKVSSKTTAQLRDQEKRIDKLMWAQSMRKIYELHPETGGNHMITNNWGNVAARIILNQFQERQSRLFIMFRARYLEAFKTEYPQHILNLNHYDLLRKICTTI